MVCRDVLGRKLVSNDIHKKATIRVCQENIVPLPDDERCYVEFRYIESE